MLAVFSQSVSAAASTPSLPSAYTATFDFAECGNLPPCAKPADTRVAYTDGKSRFAQVINVTKSGDILHQVNSPTTVYRWTDGTSDCASDSCKYPVQADWAWLSYNTTIGPTTVPCVSDPTIQCQHYEGPWPEQVTALAQLWVRSDFDGEALCVCARRG